MNSRCENLDSFREHDSFSASNNKERMLTRIRAAIGKGARAHEPIAPFYPPFSISTDSDDELLHKFCVESELAGSAVAIAESAETVTNYLDQLVSAYPSDTVAVSNAGLIERLNITEHLRASGVRVIPSWSEFGSHRGLLDEQSLQDEIGSNRLFDLREQYKRALLETRIGITSADFAIAETGSVVLLSGHEHHRLVSLLPFINVCLLDARKIVATLSELFSRLEPQHCGRESLPQAMTVITGPSRTADIEHTLTIGVHGPNELDVLIMSLRAMS
jgi:L-lactate utilization protein LutC